MTDFSQKESLTEADKTLRQLARIAPPSGLETRIHNRLAAAEEFSERRSFWALWSPARRLQFAGAALLALAVAASTWSVYHGHPQPSTQSQTPVTPQVVAPKADSSTGFKTAGAERRPSTVAPIRIKPAPRKKPSASHVPKRPIQSADPAASAKAAPAPQ